MMTNHGKRVTQGTFSFLPDLTDEQIKQQIQYALNQGWALSVEFTDDPHPRNTYWEMWDLPMFDLKDAAGCAVGMNACRKTYPNHYVKVNAFDSTRGVGDDATLVHRQSPETGNQASASFAKRLTAGSFATRSTATPPTNPKANVTSAVHPQVICNPVTDTVRHDGDRQSPSSAEHLHRCPTVPRWI